MSLQRPSESHSTTRSQNSIPTYDRSNRRIAQESAHTVNSDKICIPSKRIEPHMLAYPSESNSATKARKRAVLQTLQFSSVQFSCSTHTAQTLSMQTLHFKPCQCKPYSSVQSFNCSMMLNCWQQTSHMVCRKHRKMFASYEARYYRNSYIIHIST